MKDTLGLILTGMERVNLGDLTAVRSVAAVPVVGRYRLIDFLLSNMVNSGIINVGVSTTSNYRSLMDHLGSGSAWNLNRRLCGLFVLPPFVNSESSIAPNGDLDAIDGISNFLSRSKQSHVLLATGCNMLYTTTYNDFYNRFLDSDAEVGILCYQPDQAAKPDTTLSLSVDENGMVRDLYRGVAQEGDWKTMHIYLMRKKFLLRQLEYCVGRGLHDFTTDVLMRNLNRVPIYAYLCQEHVGRVSDVNDYYRENMKFLDPQVCDRVFREDLPVYTKLKDEVPTRYGDRANVRNSLVGDGSVIEGTVENCILFRNVHVEEGACVKDSILMQDSVVRKGASLQYTILDKHVEITPFKQLTGYSNHPVVLAKNTEL